MTLARMEAVQLSQLTTRVGAEFTDFSFGRSAGRDLE